MRNAEVAAVLERIADLLEIDGADRFRVNSYRRASRSVKDAPDAVEALAESGKLGTLPGVGKGTVARIEQYLQTGSINVLRELEGKLPPHLPDMLAIQGLGPRKIAQLHRDLGVASIEDLKAAVADGLVAELDGFGETSAKRILEGIEFLERSTGRTPLGVALPIAEALLEKVRALPGVARAEVAGSLRRGRETIGDVDILCEAADGKSIVEKFVAFEEVKRVLASGGTKGSITVGLPGGGELQVDLRVVPGESFGAAWQYFTGSKEHNVRLREIAVRKKLRLNEYGLFDGEKSLAGRTEESIYGNLGVTCPPPELREDRGELAADFSFEDLITLDDIRGDLHVHTVASDGKNSIEEMAEAARALGYKYVAICDHSESSVIANGLSIERAREHLAAIRAANDAVKGIEILAGSECDILPDGSLDYPDDLLAELDLVVASIHVSMGKGGKDKASPTERTLAAIANPYVTVIGHPTGRLLGKREAMDLDVAAIVAAAAENGTVLEINAAWQRLDLKAEHARQALDAGVTLAIDTDAHSTEGLRQMRFGVMTARRAGARRADVLNALPLAQFKKRIRAKRERARK
ncbi:MAG: DNA polymerase/3'-5' exonuclease PolX [Phycisphaerales bacterium]|nr:MAG: DNA polymerase/3'-5' exonuclease PolX [Phycisphaerales bacterium]